MMPTREINDVLHKAETESTHDMLVNQEVLVVEVGKPLGVRVVLGIVDSNKGETK